MAMGLARLFNVELPLNFNSPYKAASITDFWRRWHMTLSCFLRDCLYIPLGGNTNRFFRTSASLLVTMLVCGLWHGAGLSFVVWGGLHGLFFCVHRIWLKLSPFRLPKVFGIGLTFFCVTVAWVFFRAGSITDALVLLKAMFTVPSPSLLLSMSLPASMQELVNLPNKKIVVCAIICFLLPNSMQLAHAIREFMKHTLALVDTRNNAPVQIVRTFAQLQSRALVLVSLGMGGLLLVGLGVLLNFKSKFLY